MLLHAHFRRSNNQSRTAWKVRSSRPLATARHSSYAHTATTCGTFAGPGWLGTTGRRCATGSITCIVATTEGRLAAPCSRTPVSMAHRIGRDVSIREYIVGHTHRGSNFCSGTKFLHVTCSAVCSATELSHVICSTKAVTVN